ncbi:50S ribosomal protein L32 [bacterium]|nr:50S ribosomal protein L32 [bacterium]
MAIVPKKKRSQSKKRIRHSTRQTLNIKRLVRINNIITCKNCNAKKLAHRVCTECGHYKGKQVMTIKTKSNDNVVEA